MRRLKIPGPREGLAGSFHFSNTPDLSIHMIDPEQEEP